MTILASPPVTARITRGPLVPTATIRRGGRRGTIGEGVLYSRAGGSYAALDFPIDDKESKTAKELREKTEQKLKDIWDEAKGMLPAGATSLVINYDQLCITYTTASGDSESLDLSPTLQSLMREIRNASKTIWRKVGFAHEFGSAANRSLIGQQPFEKVTAKWEAMHPRSLERFMADDFSTMHEVLEDPKGGDNVRGREALRRIVAAEAYIQSLLHSVASGRERTNAALEAENSAPQPDQARVRALRKRLADLAQFEAKLSAVDRYPVYWAAGIWGDTDPSLAQADDRYQKAAEISADVQMALTHKLKPGDVDRGRLESLAVGAKKLIGLKDEEGERRKGMGPFVGAYAGDAGDLVVHDRLELMRRLDVDGRTMKGVCAEEFVTFNIINLDQPRFDAAAALDALDIPFDRDTRIALTRAVEGARQEARDAYTAIGADTQDSNSPEELHEALRQSNLGLLS